MEQTTLNTAMQDIELAIEQCKALPVTKDSLQLQPPPLSTTLSMIASQASSKAPGGGILHKVSGFNDFLERAALALEGKA